MDTDDTEDTEDTDSMAAKGRKGRKETWIGSGAGDCAPAPSHTTGRAVFRIRRLNAAALYTVAARSDGIQNS